jgi:hypothetical protein
LTGMTTPAEELYDSVTDPGEFTNLAADPTRNDVVAEQRAELFAFLERQGVAVTTG